mmetsp:Transcript_56403/g.120008  ORF Transcript_56403/g.120008 Transcript_56403/m.120008 type:complete len:216 (-) Transcript_56403:464-1111(-)
MNHNLVHIVMLTGRLLLISLLTSQFVGDLFKILQIVQDHIELLDCQLLLSLEGLLVVICVFLIGAPFGALLLFDFEEMLNGLALRGAAQEQVFHRHEDLPEMQGVLGVCLCGLIDHSLQTLSLLLAVIKFARQLGDSSVHLQHFHLLALFVLQKLFSKLLYPVVRLASNILQILVGTFQGVESCDKILNLTVFITGVFHRVQKFLVFFISNHLVL